MPDTFLPSTTSSRRSPRCRGRGSRRRDVERRLRRHPPEAADRARCEAGHRDRRDDRCAFSPPATPPFAYRCRRRSIRTSTPGAWRWPGRQRGRTLSRARARHRRRLLPGNGVFRSARQIQPGDRRRSVGLAASVGGSGIWQERNTVDVPVFYGGDLGPDLGRRGGLRAAVRKGGRRRAREAIAYRVYLRRVHSRGSPTSTSVDERIAAPRRATPRVRVPAGSVAIAGRQTVSIRQKHLAAGTSSGARRVKALRPVAR